jgi:glycosyltransferase involved in cell wall biosynthesis
MKFIQVFNRYIHAGGEEYSAERIARHLRLGGHEVVPFWRSSDEWHAPGAPPKWKRPLLLLRNREVLDELRALQEREGAEAWILHNVVPVVSLGVYGLAKELGVPIIQWLHNYRPISPSGNLSIRGSRLEPDSRWVYARETVAGTWHGPVLTGLMSIALHRLRRSGDYDAVKAWVPVSDEMRDLFLRAGWPAEKTHTVRHAWDIAPRTETPPGRDGEYFLFLGRMVDLKGVRFLIDLWRSEDFADIELVMAGEGPVYDEFKDSSPPNIRWTGFVSGGAKRQLIEGSRAVLFPSLWNEPLSTIAYEAYQASRPVLCSDIGGMREIVDHGRTGELIKPGDHEAWKRAVLGMQADGGRAAKLGEEGRRWLEENVSAQRWNARFASVLETALGRSASPAENNADPKAPPLSDVMEPVSRPA